MNNLSSTELKKFIHDCQIDGNHRLANTLSELLALREAPQLPAVADSIDYKALVLHIAEIAHGGPVDIGLLPVTLRSMQQLCAAPQMPGWISVDAELPDPSDARRVCAYTPSEYGDFQYRSVPASLFKSVCRQATHWHYFTVPGTAIAAAGSKKVNRCDVCREGARGGCGTCAFKDF